MLTAAHCVPYVYDFAIQLSQDPKAEKWQLSCERHPAYADQGFGANFDYALCLTPKDLPREIDILPVDGDKGDGPTKVTLLFEQLSLDPADLNIVFRREDSHWLLLSGYGCTDPSQKQLDNRLRAGFARMSFNGPIRLITGSPFRNDSAVLCSGDSGGGAYRVKTRDDPYGARVIVGVNSAFAWESHRSYLAKTSAPAFIRFFRLWRQRWGNPKVCGVDGDMGNLCHE
jgi:hypothetical protein